MLAMADEVQARHLMRFFKTGKGEYGEGDRFLGVRVPATRALVRDYRKNVSPDDVTSLLASEWHEMRLAGFLLLIEIYQRRKKRGDAEAVRGAVDYYISMLHRGNNWDLVDLVAPKILGDWLVTCREQRRVLYTLAEMDGHLWHQRVAIVATWTLIRACEYDDTLRLCRTLLHHPHDLIHKATGWMLREMGKRGGRPQLLEFLNEHATVMPRTMLRYSIEHLDSDLRRHYMKAK